jgi:hypothetical protein
MLMRTVSSREVRKKLKYGVGGLAAAIITCRAQSHGHVIPKSTRQAHLWGSPHLIVGAHHEVLVQLRAEGDAGQRGLRLGQELQLQAGRTEKDRESG